MSDDPTPEEFADPANWHPIEEHPYLNDPPNDFRAVVLRTLFREGVPVARLGRIADGLICELEKRIASAISDYADSERAARAFPDGYLTRWGSTAYEVNKRLVEDAGNIARYALSDWKNSEADDDR